MGLPRHKTVQAVAGTIRARGLVPEGSRVLVAVSGGADSVALSAILLELSGRGDRLVSYSGTTACGDDPRRPPRFDLVLAHLNHGLRETADRDEAFVASLAERWSVPLVRERADVREVARDRGAGVEEAAREARYAFLERAAVESGADRVALGHQRDDQAETVLMNFLRGSALRGLAGMPIRRPLASGSSVTLVRPLLEVGRQDLLDYLSVRGLQWVEDETNRSREAFRNRLRHDLLPELEREYARGLGRRLPRMAEQLAAAQELIAARAGAVWEEAVAAATPRAVEWHLEVLRREGRAVVAEVVLAGAEWLGAGRAGLTAEHMAQIWHVVASGAGGQRLELPGGLELSRRGKRLSLGLRDAGRRGTG